MEKTFKNIKKRVQIGVSLFLLFIWGLLTFKGLVVAGVIILGVISFFELSLVSKTRKSSSFIIVTLLIFLLMTFNGTEKMIFSKDLKNIGNIANYNFQLIQSEYIVLFIAIVGIMPIFNKNLSFKDVSTVGSSILLISLGIRSVILLIYTSAQFGEGWEVMLLLSTIVIASDIGGYFAGSAFGKHKLCPSVSPKKTWEGLFGGMILAFVTVILWINFSYVDFLGTSTKVILLVITPLIAIFAVVGDLYFSLIKRTYKLKDFSKALPGHGGILDRFDSFIFSFLGIYILLTYIKW